MGHVELARHIDAPAARVFVTVTSPELLPEWLDLVTKVRHATGALTATGMSMRAELRLGPWRRDTVWRVVSASPPRRVQLYGSSPDGGEAELMLEFGAWYGACEFRLRLDHDLGFALGAGGMGTPLLRRHLDRSIDRLAALVTGLPDAALVGRAGEIDVIELDPRTAAPAGPR